MAPSNVGTTGDEGGFNWGTGFGSGFGMPRTGGSSGRVSLSFALIFIARLSVHENHAPPLASVYGVQTVLAASFCVWASRIAVSLPSMKGHVLVTTRSGPVLLMLGQKTFSAPGQGHISYLGLAVLMLSPLQGETKSIDDQALRADTVCCVQGESSIADQAHHAAFGGTAARPQDGVASIKKNLENMRLGSRN